MTQRRYHIHALELGPMENFVYIIHDQATNRAAVVDPAWDVPEVLKLAAAHNLRVSDILLTHSHHDHVNGIEELLSATDAQIHLLKAEADFWGAELPRPTLHHGGDQIILGETTIDILHTPGHTPGSACYLVDGNLVSGDTLFVFGCGRCDLSGGNPEQMYDTLRHLRDDLPEGTTIRPGHNYAVKETSTIAEQREGNPFMHFHDVDAFVHYRMHEHDRIRNSPYGPVPAGKLA